MSDSTWRELARKGKMERAAVEAARYGVLVTIPPVETYTLAPHARARQGIQERPGQGASACVGCAGRKLRRLRTHRLNLSNDPNRYAYRALVKSFEI